jgi:hypothetical protein
MARMMSVSKEIRATESEDYLKNALSHAIFTASAASVYIPRERSLRFDFDLS